MNKKEQKIFDLLKKIQDEKDIDKIAEMIMSVISLYGMKMDEVAALNFYIMKQSLESPHNERFIQERFGIDVSKLGVIGVLDMQKALISAYTEKLKQ